MYKPLGKLTESTTGRKDIQRLFDSFFESNFEMGFWTTLQITIKDFRRLLVCQEVVDYYRVRAGETCDLAICDRILERQSDGKKNIFFGWPLILKEQGSPLLTMRDSSHEHSDITLDLTEFL